MVTQSLDDQSKSAAVALKKNIGVILNRWSERVRLQVPAASTLPDQNSLWNSLPEFLEKLAEIISTSAETRGGERYPSETIDVIRDHGRHRAQAPQYTLDQVIVEHRILREVIFEELERDKPLGKLERAKLMECIDNGIIQAATEFTARLGFEKSRHFKETKEALERSQQQTQDLKKQRDETKTEIGVLEAERQVREAFVFTLTHDLRTPMTVAKAAAEIILLKSTDDVCRDMAVKIRNCIDRADQMTRDLLDANRIRAGESIPLKLSKCDVSATIRSTISDLRALYGNRFVQDESENVECYWDCGGVRRIIENLCSNAIKYGSPTGPVTVSFKAFDDTVEIAVHNEGEPLSSSEQGALFKPFQRMRTASKSGKKGWGIGLTLVRGVAEAHGGYVRVESAPGKGTRFVVSLPRNAQIAQAEAA